MKHLILAAYLITPPAFAAEDYRYLYEEPAQPEPQPAYNIHRYEHPEPEVPPPIIFPGSGSSYYSRDQIITPKQSCYRSVATGAWVCSGW